MSWKAIDCRSFITEKVCETTIMGFEEEVLNVAVQHAIQSHGCCDNSELREQLRSMLVEESRGKAARAS
jgi:hypothetical protein